MTTFEHPMKPKFVLTHLPTLMRPYLAAVTRISWLSGQLAVNCSVWQYSRPSATDEKHRVFTKCTEKGIVYSWNALGFEYIASAN